MRGARRRPRTIAAGTAARAAAGRGRRPVAGRRIGTAARAAVVGVVSTLAAACAGGTAAANGAAAANGGAAGTEQAGSPDDAVYEVYVANESADVVSRVAFSPGRGAWVVDDIPVGIMPADLDGAHGIKVAPDGRSWYVSLAHGTPYGKVWKFDADQDTLAGRTEAGLFPATMSLTEEGDLLFVVNFNLHGDPVPSSVSVIHTPTMTVIAEPTTCVMPHGSRINAAGTKHYSVCMHSDQLVEIDTRTLEVAHRFSVSPGAEGTLSLDATTSGAHAGHGGGAEVCSPTWATPGAGARADRYVYVPCNKNSEVLEIDVVAWRVNRRFATGAAPYNLDITPDGRLLVASLKGEQAIAVFDLEEGEEIERIPTTQPVTHGVVVSPDGRYAFISNEAIGSTPGTVDVFDLERLERVASTPVQYQAGGIDFWRMSRGSEVAGN